MNYIVLLLCLICHNLLLAESYVIFHDSKESIQSEWVGGKASNLLLLEKISEIAVPKWFCVSSEMFRKTLLDNQIDVLIKQLDELCLDCEDNEMSIYQIGEAIRNRICSSPIPDGCISQIESAYDKLCLEASKKLSVAIRSSGVLEDLSSASFAGLYDTYLNQTGIAAVCQAIKKVWASSFNTRLIMDRARARISQENCLVAVIVQEMIDAEASGVACSMELSSNYPGIEICANYGIGESVVSGEASVDKWLVHSTENYIIKTVLGHKLHHSALGVDGIVYQKTKDSLQSLPCLQFDQVLQVAEQVKTIRSHYNGAIDVEFAFDQDRTLKILQARPIAQIENSTLFIVDPENAPFHQVIASGDYSVPGTVQGKLKFIDNWEDLANKKVTIEPNDIVLTYIAVNYWSHYLTQFKGLITKQGGPTTHPILLCRERGVPCLIGIGEDFENLRKYSGKTVTLDAVSRKVYEGAVPIKTADPSQLLEVFQPVQIREWKKFSERIFELKKGGHIFESEGRYWLKQPTYPLKKLLQEILLKRAERLPILINGHVQGDFKTRIIDNHVCTVILPAEKYVQCFQDMTLEECEQFSKNQEKNLHDFLKITDSFQLTPDVWQAYVDTFTDLKAYTWVAEIFRMYADKKAEFLATTLKVPQYYFDECSAAIQSLYEEEDTFMQQDIYQLASKIGSFEALQDFSQEIENLAKKYRFCANGSIEADLNLNIVHKRLCDEIDQIKTGKAFVTNKHKSNQTSFFPQNPQLYRWLCLSIYNRILQSNTHHYVMRSQWKIRDQLLRLGSYWVCKGRLQQASDIFDLSSEEIKYLIVHAW